MAEIDDDPTVWWRAHFGEFAPIGHVLRLHRAADWLRLHSLPESKRYAQTSQEMNEILRRAELLAAHLFVAGETIFLFRSAFHFPERGALSMAHGTAIFSAKTSSAEPHDDDYFSTTAQTLRWPYANFSDLIRRVANAEENMCTLTSPASSNIFCPYDGGIDTFTSRRLRAQLSRAFSNWRSSHPLGL
jgi:hypothetical protein